MLADTHCHLDFSDFDNDRDQVIKRAQEAGIGYIVNVGSSVEGSKNSVKLAGEYDCVSAVVGIHPHEADGVVKEDLDSIRDLAGKKKVVAIGEIGLDYYRNFSSEENQKRLFRSLLSLAKETGLPVVLHSRQAEADTIGILEEFMPVYPLVHCFSGNRDFLENCLRLGAMISFTCNITFKKAQSLRDIVRIVPLDKIMLETDAPYLAPEGFRGKRNEPSYVKLLAAEIARIKGISPEAVASATTGNAKRFFKI